MKSGGEGYGGEVEWGKGLKLSWNFREGWGLPSANNGGGGVQILRIL